MKFSLESMQQQAQAAHEDQLARIAAKEADGSLEELADEPLGYEAMEQRVHALWQAGDKVEAMETVLGRSVSASEIADDPNLGEIFLIEDADEAFGALLAVKEFTETPQEQSDQ